MARFRERIETRRMPYRLGICCFSPFSWRYSRCGTATTLCTGPFHRFPASSITAAPNCWSCRHRFVLGLASAYFFYLAVLKTKLAREQRNRDGTRE